MSPHPKCTRRDEDPLRELPYQIDSKETQRFLHFLVVGAGDTIIDFSLLSLLKLLGLSTLPANTISYLAGVINNFYWNRRWTFSETQGYQIPAGWAGRFRFDLVPVPKK